MKKIFLVLVLGVISTTCYAFNSTTYQHIQPIQPLSVSQPTLVEIPDIDQKGNSVVVKTGGVVVEQQFQSFTKVKVIQPSFVEACMKTCEKAPSLVDMDYTTTYDFPITQEGAQKGSIAITYPKSFETDSITFNTTADSYMPTTFTLTIDGKRVLNTIEGSSAYFPKMTAQTIKITFEYTQPIRFTEVSVGVNKEETTTNSIRFVYQPNTTYSVYSYPTVGRESVPTPPINLFAKKKDLDIYLPLSQKNPEYKEVVYEEKDSDGDGVFDTKDNCYMQKNADQKDSNTNGIGDVCDDYDYDGVPTYLDNCPTIANPLQEDSDRDGLGDACDTEESRITEKYAWIPWTVFVFVFLSVSFMGYEVLKKKR